MGHNTVASVKSIIKLIWIGLDIICCWSRTNDNSYGKSFVTFKQIERIQI